MTELSPAAQVVLNAAEDAYGINYSEFHCCADRVAAAALRAAADRVVPHEPVEAFTFTNEAIRLSRMGIRAAILAIATELEGTND